ncbi:BROMO [Musa troglodytarum]|uniref:BROMO n=1 Tax=Musa troglodytarum TaxID=320322 RepID=A0A9E7HIZ1_9LILI|nr:BROMO [Musa troglodytarum]
MARSGDAEEIWGTWEELLLACAVNRHGTRRWESVAMEIQSRTSVSQLVTPQGCHQRYRDLQRRFGAGVGVVNGSGDDDGGDADPDSKADVPWLEELRRLRVAELRREVKSLQVERERSLREADSGEEKPDHETKKEGGPLVSTPESLAGNRISSGGDSGRSCDQSHSNDPQRIPGEECREQGKASGLVAPGSNAADPSAVADEKAAEGSCNGSTGSPTVGAAARKQAMGDSGESIAESKRGEEGEGEKESSDVQSSASLSRRRRKPVFFGGSGGGAEAAAESQPLVDLLEIFRSDKYGSAFERRLESQLSLDTTFARAIRKSKAVRN